MALFKKSGVKVKVTCSLACSGKAKLLSVKPVKIKGKKVRKGILLAATRFKMKAGTRTIRLKIRGKRARKVLKRSRKGLVKLSGGTKRKVRIRR